MTMTRERPRPSLTAATVCLLLMGCGPSNDKIIVSSSPDESSRLKRSYSAHWIDDKCYLVEGPMVQKIPSPRSDGTSCVQISFADEVLTVRDGFYGNSESVIVFYVPPPNMFLDLITEVEYLIDDVGDGLFLVHLDSEGLQLSRVLVSTDRGTEISCPLKVTAPTCRSGESWSNP